MSRTRFRSSRLQRVAAWSAAMIGSLLVVTADTAGADSAVGEPGHLSRAPGDVGVLVDRIVSRQLTEHRIPGAAVTVVAGGRTVLSKGYGLADVERATPVDAERTGFFPASVVKLFTATAASQLIAQGRLDPDADVNRYLTSFKVRDTYPGRPVTMNHLLTHTAGFDQDFVGLNSATGDDVATLAGSLADVQPARVRPPGAVVAYDNYGFALAGHVVEEVSGQPFDRYVRRNILDPLGMTATTLQQPHPGDVAADRATGYRPDGDGYTASSGQYGPWTPTGGGTVTTAADIGRFMIAQLVRDPRLGPGVTDLMQRQHYTQDDRVPGMAYGFTEERRNGHRMLLKDGDLPGFHGNLALLPDDGIGIYVVYNGDGVDNAAFWDGKDLAHQVADDHIPPERPSPPAAAATDAARYAGTYRASTTSEHSLMRVAALTAPVTVETEGDGGLVTSGLSLDPATSTQHWVPAGPGVFTTVDGHGRIAFTDDGVLAGAGPEATAYQRLPWYQDPSLHMAVLGVGLAVLLGAFVWFPVAALIRRRGDHPHRSRGVRIARATGWATGALAVAFTGGFLFLVADGNAMMEAGILGSPLLTVLPFLPALMILTSAGVVVATPVAWHHGWWRLPGKLGYTMLALAAIAFLVVAIQYNLVALGDYRGS